MFITKIKSFFKKYWLVLLGALAAFFALIIPRKIKYTIEKKNYDNRVIGQQYVLDADKSRDEKIEHAQINAKEKLNKIEDDKQVSIKALTIEPQKDLTEKLSKEFNFNNLDN